MNSLSKIPSLPGRFNEADLNLARFDLWVTIYSMSHKKLKPKLQQSKEKIIFAKHKIKTPFFLSDSPRALQRGKMYVAFYSGYHKIFGRWIPRNFTKFERVGWRNSYGVINEWKGGFLKWVWLFSWWQALVIFSIIPTPTYNTLTLQP